MHGNSPELCRRSRPIPQIMIFVFPAFTLSPFSSIASFQVKSLLTHSLSDSACLKQPSVLSNRGWSGGAKVSCILCHRGVQLILAYSWARPAIVEVGKSRGGMFLFFLFLPFHSFTSFFPVPLFHLFYYLFYLFSPFLWETT